MQTVLKKELIIDNSHSFLLSDLPQVKNITDADIDAEIVTHRSGLMQQPVRKVCAHRIVVDNIELSAREYL